MQTRPNATLWQMSKTSQKRPWNYTKTQKGKGKSLPNINFHVLFAFSFRGSPKNHRFLLEKEIRKIHHLPFPSMTGRSRSQVTRGGVAVATKPTRRQISNCDATWGTRHFTWQPGQAAKGWPLEEILRFWGWTYSKKSPSRGVETIWFMDLWIFFSQL